MKKLPFILLSLLTAFGAVAAQGIKTQTGPYLQAVSEHGFTVVWTTDADAVAWVEVAPDDGSDFYAVERPRFYQSEHGRRTIGRLHKVTVDGLEPGTCYRYRIFAQQILERESSHPISGRVAASRVYKHEPYRLTTLDRAKEKVRFAVVNDIHGNDSLLRRLLGDVTRANTDLVFFNGDMTSSVDSEEQIARAYLGPASELFAAEVPLVMVRGNHENRGTFSHRLSDYFASPEGRYYYLFRQGPVCFVVLDCGEDKPDNDIEYSGLADFDRYRARQAEWLRQAVASDEFRNAPVRIVLLHIPPLHYDWHGGREVQERFMPLLQGAGVDLLLCGHLHKAFYDPAGADRYDFPILINSNRECVRVEASAGEIAVEVRDAEGKVTRNIRIPKK